MNKLLCTLLAVAMFCTNANAASDVELLCKEAVYEDTVSILFAKEMGTPEEDIYSDIDEGFKGSPFNKEIIKTLVKVIYSDSKDYSKEITGVYNECLRVKTKGTRI